MTLTVSLLFRPRAFSIRSDEMRLACRREAVFFFGEAEAESVTIMPVHKEAKRDRQATHVVTRLRISREWLVRTRPAISPIMTPYRELADFVRRLEVLFFIFISFVQLERTHACDSLLS